MCWIDRTTSLSEAPLLIRLNNPLFVLGLHSAAWLRGPERAKLANSLEDLYVWVLFIIPDFKGRQHEGMLATTKASRACLSPGGVSLWPVSCWECVFTWNNLNSYREHVGESILYLWVEEVREFLVEKSQSAEAGEGWKIHALKTHSSYYDLASRYCRLIIPDTA